MAPCEKPKKCLKKILGAQALNRTKIDGDSFELHLNFTTKSWLFCQKLSNTFVVGESVV